MKSSVILDEEKVSDRSLSVLQRLDRAATFYKKAIPVLVSYKSLDAKLKFEKNVLGKDIPVEEEEKQWNLLHDWGSDCITEVITELKGFYVKTGQIISTRVDIFPEQYTTKLAIMQDGLDPLPGDLVLQIVKEELLDGGEISDLFTHFDLEPIGSASIAQVQCNLIIMKAFAQHESLPPKHCTLVGSQSYPSRRSSCGRESSATWD